MENAVTQNMVTVHNVQCWLREGVAPSVAIPILHTTLEQLFRGELRNQKSGRRKELYRVRDTDGVEYLLKVNRYPWFTALRRGKRPSKARHELHVAQGVAARGLPTPVPLAAGELRENGILRQCFEWMPVLSNVCDLKLLWEQRESVSPKEMRAITTQLGTLVRATISAQVFQDDLAPNNILLRRGEIPELFLIDFERAELNNVELSDTEKRWMLAKLDRHLADASAAARMRFLHAYCAGERKTMRSTWKALRDFAPLLAERDFARMQRKSARTGRRYAEIRIKDWSGFVVQSRFDRACVENLLSRESSESTLGPRVTPCKPVNQSRGEASTSAEIFDTTWVMRYTNLSSRAARALWSAANTLEIHGRLTPSPIALLRRGTTTLLLSQKYPASLTLADVASNPNAVAATRVLLDRLLTLGELTRELSSDAIALEPRSPESASGTPTFRATLLDPYALRFVARSHAEQDVDHIARAKAKQAQSLQLEFVSLPTQPMQNDNYGD